MGTPFKEELIIHYEKILKCNIQTRTGGWDNHGQDDYDHSDAAGDHRRDM